MKKNDIIIFNDKKLGEGGFSKVYLGLFKPLNLDIAIKVINIKKLPKDTYRMILREIEIQKKLKHENIIKLLGYFEEKNFLYLIMELSSKTNLFDFIHKRENYLTDNEIINIFNQIINAIEYIHSHNILHRDIKPENILISENYEIKITDFGFSNYLNNSRNTFCGTFEYMAPEIFEFETQTKKTDIWALGILLYELINKKSLFNRNKDTRNILEKIKKKEFIFKENVNLEGKDLCLKMLEYDFQKRLTILEIKNHVYLKKNLRKNILENILNEEKKFENLNNNIMWKKNQFKKKIIQNNISTVKKISKSPAIIRKISRYNLNGEKSKNVCYKKTFKSNDFSFKAIDYKK